MIILNLQSPKEHPQIGTEYLKMKTEYWNKIFKDCNEIYNKSMIGKTQPKQRKKNKNKNN